MHALLKSTCEIPVPKERSLRLTEQVNPVLSNEVRRRLRYMHMQSFDQNKAVCYRRLNLLIATAQNIL